MVTIFPAPNPWHQVLAQPDAPSHDGAGRLRSGLAAARCLGIAAFVARCIWKLSTSWEWEMKFLGEVGS